MLVGGATFNIFLQGGSMRPILSAGLVLAFVSGLAFGAAPSDAQNAQSSPLVLPKKLTPRYTVIPYRGRTTASTREIQAASNKTIPLWSHTAHAGGISYKFQMVGKNPLNTLANPSTTIKTVIIPVIFTFKDVGSNVVGTSDPTVVDPNCSPTGSAVAMVKNSPVFKNLKDFHAGAGPKLGTGQYVDLFQRASFHKQTAASGINPDYHVTLNPVMGPTFSKTQLSGTWASASGTCGGTLFAIDINTWDTYLQNTLFPQLATAGFGPNTFPLFLFYNVVMYDGSSSNCCILGYHSAFDNPSFGNAFQAYGISDYEVSGAFDPAGTSDVSVLTHEVAEWMDDPTGVNPTPDWGHTGQVTACQNNLEVGDPLSGTIKPITMPNGFTYHVQDLAFWPWFYDGNAPFKVTKGGNTHPWFSMYGTFKKPAVEPCT
jgi:hypothetical protein